ncbi:MAG: VCBS repeat-containing protein [Saprospiraceae bacterium]|nr:VCBS repeat-containing protein [Saprospiraceae bacterium]
MALFDTPTIGPLQLNTDLYGSSGRRKWCFTHSDQDGDQDILINSTNVAWFENVEQENEKISFVFQGDLSDQKLAGQTTSPTTVDWDRNGKPDYSWGGRWILLLFAK